MLYDFTWNRLFVLNVQQMLQPFCKHFVYSGRFEKENDWKFSLLDNNGVFWHKKKEFLISKAIMATNFPYN